jgi:hypothetical protein
MKIRTPIATGIVALIFLLLVAYLIWSRHSRDDNTATPNRTTDPTSLVEQKRTDPNSGAGAAVSPLEQKSLMKKIIEPAQAVTNPLSEERIGQLAQLMRSRVDEANARIDFYGVVLDQYNTPIAGASIRARIRSWVYAPPAGSAERIAVHDLVTDATGRFQLENMRGDYLTIESVAKDGHELSKQVTKVFGYRPPEDFRASKLEPVIFRMWRAGTPQELQTNSLRRASLACDGQPFFVNLDTGEKGRESGDLKITLVRDPVNLPPNANRYDWTAEFEIPNGGLIASGDEFMKLAPETGYTQRLRISFQKSDPEWTSTLRTNFFLKARDGAIYGRMEVRLTTNYQPPPTGLTLNIVLNRSGSRTLE